MRWYEPGDSRWEHDTFTPTQGSAVPITVEGRGEANPSDGAGPPARTVQTCPRCEDLILLGEGTARVNGNLWHLRCYEEWLWEDER